MKKYAILLTFVLVSAIFLVGCFKPPSIGDIIPKVGNNTPKATDQKKDPVIGDYYDAADHPIRRRLSQAFHEMGAKCSEPQGASIRWV